MGVATVNFFKIPVVFSRNRRIGDLGLEIQVTFYGICYFHVKIIRKVRHGLRHGSHIKVRKLIVWQKHINRKRGEAPLSILFGSNPHLPQGLEQHDESLRNRANIGCQCFDLFCFLSKVSKKVKFKSCFQAATFHKTFKNKFRGSVILLQ